MYTDDNGIWAVDDGSLRHPSGVFPHLNALVLFDIVVFYI
jgi:hypothetical protein